MPQFTPAVFEIDAISSRKPPTHALKDAQDHIIYDTVYQQKIKKVI